LILNGAPREIRTPDLLIRSQSLYPAELWAHKQVTANSFKDIKLLAKAQMLKPEKQKQEHSGAPLDFHA
jgi:hypothetical protein